MEPDFSYYASNRGGGGRGSRGCTVGGRGETSGVRGETSESIGRFGKGREGEEGVEMMVGEQAELAEEMIKDEIRDNMEHEYMEQLLIKEEEKRAVEDKAR
ncbi:hypothetical protein Tco_0564295 [Tanacetum coccineum]